MTFNEFQTMVLAYCKERGSDSFYYTLSTAGYDEQQTQMFMTENEVYKWLGADMSRIEEDDDFSYRDWLEDKHSIWIYACDMGLEWISDLSWDDSSPVISKVTVKAIETMLRDFRCDLFAVWLASYSNTYVERIRDLVAPEMNLQEFVENLEQATEILSNIFYDGLYMTFDSDEEKMDNAFKEKIYKTF